MAPLAPLLFAALLLGQSTAAQAQFDLRRLMQSAGQMMQRGTCEKLKTWVENPAPEQAPPAEGRRRVAGDRGGDDMRLIADEVFVPAFGKPYDQLTQADLTGYQRDTLRACHSMGLFTPQQAQQVSQLLNPGTHPMYSQRLAQRRAEAGARAAAQTAAAQELRQLQAELDGLEASDAGLSRLQQLSQRVAQLERNAAPQDVAAYNAAAQQARLRIGGPAQQDRIARALAAAQDPSSLQRLMSVEASLDRSLLPPGDSQLAQLQDRIRELAAATAAHQRAELAAIPAGLDGLAAGAQWSQRHGASGAVAPELRRVQDEFRQQRDRQLASPAVVAQLEAAVAAARTPAQVDALPSRYLLAGEEGSAAGRALQSASSARHAAMERNVALGRDPSADPLPPQRVQAAAPVRTAPPQREAPQREPLARGEPSEEVMFDMVNLRFTRAAENYRNLLQKCDQTRPNGNSMGGMMDGMVCLSLKMQGAVTGNAQAEPVKITKFRKLGCDRASGKPGYVCDYMITTSHPVSQQMGSILGGLMGQGGVGQARFLDTGDSWVIFYRGSEAD